MQGNSCKISFGIIENKVMGNTTLLLDEFNERIGAIKKTLSNKEDVLQDPRQLLESSLKCVTDGEALHQSGRITSGNLVAVLGLASEAFNRVKSLPNGQYAKYAVDSAKLLGNVARVQMNLN